MVESGVRVPAAVQKTDIVAIFLSTIMSKWRSKQQTSQAGSGRTGHGMPRRPLGGHPGPTRMDLMASISRSSGLEKGGDEWVFLCTHSEKS